MEFLEGKTLKHTIAGRPIEIEALLDVAIGVAGDWTQPTQRELSTGMSNRQTSS